MEAALVESIILLFERSALVELEYSEANGDCIRMFRQASTVAADAPAPSAALPVPDLVAKGRPLPSAPATSMISAAMPGVFHRGPAPGAPDFVAVGDLVAEGQALGILEAMKVLNRIQADCAGRVVEILADNGALVDAGAPLFKLEAADASSGIAA